MLKVSIILRSADPSGTDAFLAHRAEAAPEIFERLRADQEWLRYAQYRKVSAESPIAAAGTNDFLGSEEYWFASEEAARRFFGGSNPYRDGTKVVPYLQACLEVSGQVHPIWDAATEAAKVLVLGAGKRELTIEQYRHHWINVHGPLAMENPGGRDVRGRVEYCPADPLSLTGLELGSFDGVASIYVKGSLQVFQKEVNNDYYRDVLKPDEHRFSDPFRSVAIIVSEYCSCGEIPHSL